MDKTTQEAIRLDALSRALYDIITAQYWNSVAGMYLGAGVLLHHGTLDEEDRAEVIKVMARMRKNHSLSELTAGFVSED